MEKREWLKRRGMGEEVGIWGGELEELVGEEGMWK